jgi:hypothetical protein
MTVNPQTMCPWIHNTTTNLYWEHDKIVQLSSGKLIELKAFQLDDQQRRQTIQVHFLCLQSPITETAVPKQTT